MKQIAFLLSSVMIIMSAVATANAGKCVRLMEGYTTCNGTDSSGVEWEGTCTTIGANVPSVSIKGIGVCSNKKDDYLYSAGDLSTVDSISDTTNVNCWCKMTEPVESAWVFVYTYSSNTLCMRSCSERCRYNLSVSDPEFLELLFLYTDD